MQTGKLDQRVDLSKPSQTNVSGELKEQYVDVATSVPAHVISQRGSEAFEAARTNARKAIRVLMRFRPDVSNTWRLKWEDEFYNITDVDRSLRRDGQLWVTAEAVGAR